MVTKEINPGKLITGLAAILKENGMVNPPQWSEFVKTGAHAERPPENPDWWFIRAASIFRQVYTRGPIGVGKLRNWYGGRKNRGSSPERHYPAGGKIIRTCLQQLEGAGLILKEGSGRKITAKGQSLIDKTAASLKPRSERPKAQKKAAKPKPAKAAKPPAKQAKPKPPAKQAKPKPPAKQAKPEEAKPPAGKPKEAKPEVGKPTLKAAKLPAKQAKPKEAKPEQAKQKEEEPKAAKTKEAKA